MRTPSAGALALSLLSLSAHPAHVERRVLDDFSDPALWTAAPAAGVALALSPTTGPDGGHALRLDFDFQGHGGWAIARRALPLDLPESYRFAFEIRGDALPNTIEFKLIDESGENVWWSTRREFAFPHEWTEIRIPKRKIAFAWGPLGGGELHRAAALEIAITAGQGGKGTVELADLSIEELPPPHPYIGHPTAKASSAILDSAPECAIDGDPHTAWRSGPEDSFPEIAIDFGELRTFGGLTLHWAPGGAPASYRVDLSDDGKAYRTARTVAATNGGD
ncbi:MAG TPA: discoidin domain-containing protein, partial [Thermoanaerobaculia bacterium]|nr:discoidin domain-containing protein [Thermoanaerobaculia bacterium]